MSELWWSNENDESSDVEREAFLADINGREYSDWTLGEWIEYFKKADDLDCDENDTVKEMRAWLADDKAGDLVFAFVRASASDVDEDRGCGCCSASDVDQEAEEVVAEPSRKARRIFIKTKTTERVDTSDAGFPELQNKESVSKSVYHNAIRQKFVAVLRASGICLSSEDSVDKDLVFLKASLPLDGKTIKSLAEQYRFRMPFKPSDSRAIRRNSVGIVPIYSEYSKELADQMQPFTKVDAIRILRRRLVDLVDLGELREQNIIAKLVYKGSYEECKENADMMCRPGRWLCPPNEDEIQLARQFYGEKIAFLVFWVAFVFKWVAAASVPALILSALRKVLDVWALLLTGKKYMEEAVLSDFGKGFRNLVFFSEVLHCVFLFIIMFAVSFLCGLFRNAATSQGQIWGVTEGTSYYWSHHELVSKLISSTKRKGKHSGRPRRNLRLLRFSISCAVTGYFIFCLGVITFSWTITEDWKDWRSNDSVRSILPATMSIILRAAWGPIARFLTNMMEWQSQSDWDTSLLHHLFVIRVPITIAPGFYAAYVKNFVEFKCGAALTVIAQSLSSDPLNRTLVTMVENSLLKSDWSTASSGNSCTHSDCSGCIKGCYPTDCILEESEEFSQLLCKSNCVNLLQTFLAIYIVFLALEHIAYALYFGNGLTKASGGGGNVGLELRRPPGDLETRPKCYDLLYSSKISAGWSYAHDYIDLISILGLIACFGVVMPGLIWAGAPLFVIVYRIKIWLIVNSVPRPYPTASNIFTDIQFMVFLVTVVAVMANVANFVVLMVPCRTLPNQDQELVFAIMEHACLFVHIVIYALFPHHSIKGDRIEEKHEKYLLQHASAGRYDPHTPEILQDISDFDVGVYNETTLRRRNRPQDVDEEGDEEYE